MAHKLGLQLGQITRTQYRTLDSLKKAGDTEEYENLERLWGTTRKQLEKRYGKRLIEKLDKQNKKGNSGTMVRTRTKGRSRGHKYPVRRRGVESITDAITDSFDPFCNKGENCTTDESEADADSERENW